MQTRSLELLRDVERGLVVLRRTRPVRRRRQDLQLLAGQLRVGNAHERMVPLGLLREVGVSEHLRCGRLRVGNTVENKGQGQQ